MQDRLRKIYLAFLIPAVLGFVTIGLIRHNDHSLLVPLGDTTVLAPAILILAVFFGLAGPILYRSLFAHRKRHLSSIPVPMLFRFERNLTGMALVVPYLALVGYYLQLPRFHLAATLLVALYAVYYHYPSRKRIAFDTRIFRTEEGIPAERLRSHEG